MSRKPYSTYHGRRSLGQRILMAVAVILAVALLLALVALFVLPNYMTYDGDTLQFNLPLPGRGQGGQATTSPQPTDGEGEPDIVIDDHPSAPPSPTPTAAGAVDLSQLERREAPLGLVSTAGTAPREGDGSIFDMTGDVDKWNEDLDADRAAERERNLSLPYAAAWLAPDWAEALAGADFAEALTQRCLALADSGYDEIIFSQATPKDSGADLAKLYRGVKAELDRAGWQGRLGLVLDQGLVGSQYDEDLMPAIAQSFDRLYFGRAMQANVKSALTTNGFEDKPANYVTVYATIPSVNWSWAILPQQA